MPRDHQVTLVHLNQAHDFAPVSFDLKLRDPAVAKLPVEDDSAFVSPAPRNSREDARLTEVDE
jgi:hypothetical protein